MLKRYFIAHLIGICKQQRYRIGLIGLLVVELTRLNAQSLRFESLRSFGFINILPNYSEC